MILSIAYLLFLILGFVINGFAEEFCHRILRELGDAQQKFVYCTTVHSQPATSCINCYDLHISMEDKYGTLVKTPNCSEMYLNQNRLNLVYTMQKSLDDIWNKGFCDDCFENGSLSNSTLKFEALSTDFYDCLSSPKTKNPCLDCETRYVDLNDFYRKMDEEKKSNICFDMQDTMNRTRSKWSRDLKCCRREFSLLLFIVGSSFFCALPVIFYLGMYGYTKRLERNHEVIDSTFGTENQEPIASTSEAASSSTLAILSSEEPTTSTGRASLPEENLKKKLVQLRDPSPEQGSSKETNESLIIL